MDLLDGWTFWMDGPTGWTFWLDLLVGPPEWTHWMDLTTGPTGLTDCVQSFGLGEDVEFEENLEARANLYKNPPRRMIRTSAWCRGVTSQQ